jgi:hypothetical protein
MKPPADVVPDMIWVRVPECYGLYGMNGYLNPDAHAEPCHVYWGSHGCDRPRGHEGAHWCDCCRCDDHPDPCSGCVAGPPYYGPDTIFHERKD